MHYTFPRITHIDDVLPHVKDNPSFVVADKGSYIVINYYSLVGDPFGSIQASSQAEFFFPEDLIRRECRGIIFDKATGRIISRRYHKFFNINEREETLVKRIDLSIPHFILDKLDGSMITPFMTSDEVLRWGTKMGETDVAIPVLDFVESNPRYKQFAELLLALAYTPIFEWCSQDNRIVISHPKPRLVLTAVRDMYNGTYWDFEHINDTAKEWNIDVVDSIHTKDLTIDQVIEQARGLVGDEGYVLRFHDGHMVKIKSDWYVAIHKAKDDILYERNVVRLIEDDKLDDVLSFLVDSDRDRITRFSEAYKAAFAAKINGILELVNDTLRVKKLSRKDFAIDVAPQMGPFVRPVFQMFDELTSADFPVEKLVEQFHQLIYSKTSSNSNWEAFKKAADVVLDFTSTSVEE